MHVPVQIGTGDCVDPLYQFRIFLADFSNCLPFADAKTLLGLSSDIELVPLLIQEETDIQKPPLMPRQSTDLPLYESTRDGDDNLNDVRFNTFFPSFIMLFKTMAKNFNYTF